MKRKRQSAPEVLLRVYGNRVRTLADTILSLLPQPPKCCCKARGCLGCCGRPFLLRDGDDSDYVRLLTHAFAVVADHAPPIPVFLPYQRWPHHKIVQKTIETAMFKSSETANVICNGYDKEKKIFDDMLYEANCLLQISSVKGSLSDREKKNQWLCISPIVHLLTTPTWNLLLNRICDDLMVHLLRYVSLFLPLSNNNYLQVSGHPVNGSFQCSKLPKKEISGPQLGRLKERQTEAAIDEKLNCNKSVSVQQPSRLLHSAKLTGFQVNDAEVKPKKRTRQFSWQRRRKRRLMDFPESNILHGCLTSDNGKERSGKKLDLNSPADLGRSGKCKVPTIHDVREQIFGGRSQLHTPETIAFGNDGLIIDESLHDEHPKEVHKDVPFPFSRVVDSDSIQVSTGSNDLKVGAFDKSLSSGSFIGSGSIQAALGTNELKPDAFKNSLSLQGTSMGPSKGSFDYNKQSCPRTDIQHKVLPSSEIDKQHPLPLPSKKCFYCLMLQAPLKVARGTQVKRQRVFYISCQSRSLFPRKHILNKVKPNDSGAITLMRHIFGLPVEHKSGDSFSCSHNISTCPIKQDCLYHSLMCSLKSLIRKARHCQYLKLLNKHCPISVLKSCNITKGVLASQRHEVDAKFLLKHRKKIPRLKFFGNSCFGKSCGCLDAQQEGFPVKTTKSYNDEMKLSKCYCNHKQVVAFIWAACRSIIPIGLLGSRSTWRALRRNISRFVELRRYEQFSINQCIHGLKTSSFPMLSKITISSSCMFNCSLSLGHGNGENKLEGATTLLRNKVFNSCIFWFFSRFVIPIIQANFYVTESEFGKQGIFYYRKPIWKRLMNTTIYDLKEQNYRCLDLVSSREVISKRTLGFSKVRFLPKEHGLRPIVNLKAPSKVWHPVQICSSSKQSLGEGTDARVHCQSEILSYGGRFKKMNSVNSVLRDLFAVLNRVKVEQPSELGSSVFDYNDIYKKLCPFLIGLRNGYTTMPKVFIVAGDVFKAFDAVDQNKLLGIMKQIINNNEYHIKRYAQVSCARKSLRVHYGLASVDQSRITNITNFAASISSHSSNCVFIDQVKSIKMNKGGLHRLLHEHVKQNLLQLGQSLYMQEVGIPQGSVLSSLLCSFYYGHLERNVILPSLENSHQPSTVRCGNSGEQGVNRSDSACNMIYEVDHVAKNTDGICKNQGSCVPRHILLRLIDDFLFISTCKGLACYFLSMLNEGFEDYNCWMNKEKFHLNFNPGNESGILPNMVYTGEDGVSFLPWSGLLLNCSTLEIQADYTSYMYKLIKKRMRRLNSIPNHHPILQLSKDEIKWLGLSAYIRALKKKQSRYVELLSLLRYEVGKYKRLEGNFDLKYAVDDSHSSMFWKIKY